ncbi:Uncharacterised protein [Enterococcus faecalis]|uniref:hypothetical protein n=1 Tax=Enterococcus faecalis TaxID=1351 RepID=UPI00033079CF|nr:hypothetical protein [Enterococcus faecalis]EOJ77393.1 hypothetical protein WO7_00996 [Enterococcus faecalis EnGen0355]VFA74213.1 Uncharacterised protein [Enterococcus faecalis]VFA74232.1 Uncharacterised protein [Enterococcus faecalis]DAE50685.1 MAG TPA: hypothetical protein [Caudoviricetes sp.]
MNRSEADALDRFLTEPPKKQNKEQYENDEIDSTDFFGNEIADEDGVFQMWFKIFKYDKKAQLKCHELTAIVTQNSIVDVIEEFDQQYLEKIDYIGLGKVFKEALLND